MTVIPLASELPDADAPIELKDLGLSQRDALLSVTDDTNLWRSPDGETFATIDAGGHLEHHAVTSRSFRDWMLAEVARRYLSNGRPASVSESAVRDARQAIEARAYVERVVQPAPLRVTLHEHNVYIDLGSDDWSAVEVHRNNWRIVETSPAPIVRSRRTAAMPVPAGKGGFVALRQLLHRLSESDFLLFTAWCLGAMWPTGPYPVLILGGEQGSGKSTLARLAQKIVDPVGGNLLQPPVTTGT